MATAILSELRDEVGETIPTEDPPYEDARRVYNAMIERRTL